MYAKKSAAPPKVFVIAALLSFAASSAPGQTRVPLAIATGVPLRVRLTERVPIQRAGTPVEGVLAAPVYVYDRQALPAGIRVFGRITRVNNASRMRRARAIVNGSFSPLRSAEVTFDEISLPSGGRAEIETRVAPGAAPMVLLTSPAGAQRGGAAAAIRGEWRRASSEERAVLDGVRQPGRFQRLKELVKRWAAAEIPYHRPALQPGTLFTATLEAPLSLGEAAPPAPEAAEALLPPDSTLRARLVTPLGSDTAHPGGAVEAIITEPVFSPGRELLVPQGSRLEGRVLRAQPARRLRRNGKLRFTFQRLVRPQTGQAGATAPATEIHASVDQMEVKKNQRLKLDSEGGVQAVSSKARFLYPALALWVAVGTATPDRDAVSGDVAGAVPGQGGAAGRVVAGGWGLGLAGSVVSLAVKSRALTAAFGFYGAAWSIYRNLLARGRNVDFPEGTPIEVRLGSHERPAPKTSPPAAPSG